MPHLLVSTLVVTNEPLPGLISQLHCSTVPYIRQLLQEEPKFPLQSVLVGFAFGVHMNTGNSYHLLLPSLETAVLVGVAVIEVLSHFVSDSHTI